MKLLYRNTECTFMQFLSAILATTVATEEHTLRVVHGLVEGREYAVRNRQTFYIGPSTAKIIDETTAGNCKVAA